MAMSLNQHVSIDRQSAERERRRSRERVEIPPSDDIERRVAPRSVALEFRAYLGFWEGTDFVITGVRLLDISRAGIALEAEDAPDVGQDAWFRLHPAGSGP